MDELTAFLAARLDEEETAAQKLLRYAREVILTLKDPWFLGRRVPGWHSWPDVEAMCESRLRDVAAKREILDLHRPNDKPGPGRACTYCGYLWPCAEVRITAAIWQDHPDYDAAVSRSG